MTRERSLRAGPGILIPATELAWEFDPSGGPGGQHANRSSTRATVKWRFASSAALTGEQKARLRAKLGQRGRRGTITISVDRERSQARNRAEARRRLAQLVSSGLVIPKRRHRTKPSAGALQRRRETKTVRAKTKQLRRRPAADD